MKNFNQRRWNLLCAELKVAIACRYCYLQYFSNIVVQTQLPKTAVHIALNNLTDKGCLKERWEHVGTSWVKCYKYDDHCTNDYIDMVIKELE